MYFELPVYTKYASLNLIIMTQANDLNHLINELFVADQVLKTVDKAQKPDPVVEKVVVEKIVNVEKPIAVPREVKKQTSDDLLVFSVFF